MATDKREKRYSDVIAARQEGIVVFEDITDPHNAQAAFRSCDIFGFQKVYLVFENEKPFDPLELGRYSSSSAHKWLSFRVFTSSIACMEQLSRDGYERIATVSDRAVEDITGAPFEKAKSAFIFGNEKRGISETIRKHADRLVTIPEAGMAQSLNLSVSVGIVLFEVTRQRKTLGMNRYRLSPTKQKALEKDFRRR